MSLNQSGDLSFRTIALARRETKTPSNLFSRSRKRFIQFFQKFLFCLERRLLFRVKSSHHTARTKLHVLFHRKEITPTENKLKFKNEFYTFCSSFVSCEFSLSPANGLLFFAGKNSTGLIEAKGKPFYLAF